MVQSSGVHGFQFAFFPPSVSSTLFGARQCAPEIASPAVLNPAIKAVPHDEISEQVPPMDSDILCTEQEDTLAHAVREAVWVAVDQDCKALHNACRAGKHPQPPV